RQLGFQLGAGLLALLEALLAHLELGLELCLAEVECGLALLQLLRAAGEDMFPFVERLLLALVAAPGREDRLLGLVERRLARRELELALSELAGTRGEALVAAVGTGELRLVLREHLLAGLEL